MSNPFVAHNRLPFNFEDGLEVKGIDLSGPNGSSGIGHTSLNGSLTTLGTVVSSIEYALSEIQYVNPSVTSLLINGSSALTSEKGVSIASINLTWTLSGSVPNSQSINNGVGTVPVGTLVKTVTGPFTSNATYTLTVTDTNPAGATVTATRSSTMSFIQKRHWGVSTLTSLDSAGILSLSGSELSTSRAKTVVYNAEGGRYIYYAYPESYGALSSVTVNNLSFSDYSVSIISHTNASGFTENYRVIRFNNIQNGTAISVVWS